MHRGTLGGEHILRATVFGDASGGHPDPPDVALPADCFNIGPSPQMPVPTSKRSKKRQRKPTKEDAEVGKRMGKERKSEKEEKKKKKTFKPTHATLPKKKERKKKEETEEGKKGIPLPWSHSHNSP